MWRFLETCALLVFFYKLLNRLIGSQTQDDDEFEQVSTGFPFGFARPESDDDDEYDDE